MCEKIGLSLYNIKKDINMKYFFSCILIFLSQQYVFSQNEDSILNTNSDTVEIFPHLPDFIDINNDGIIDFIIEYWNIGTHDVPQSSRSISGQIMPEKNNKILYNGALGYLYLEKGDTIWATTQRLPLWSQYPGTLVIISWDINEGWDNSWKVYSKKEPPYYIAFVLIQDQINYLGWMEISISTFNGKTSIIDFSFSENESIIVGQK